MEHQVLHLGDLLPHVLGQDLHHSHRADIRQDVLTQAVPVPLPGGHLDLVVLAPGVLYVPLGGLPPARRVAHPPQAQYDLRPLPRPVRLPPGGKLTRGLLMATDRPDSYS